MTLTVTSPAFKHKAYIPKRHACGAEDVSPELKWSGLPDGTGSVAVIMDDPDAPPGTWVHWILFNIPPSAKGLKENVAKKEVLPDGSRHGRVWGVNEDDFSRIGYYGPCPPPGKPHHYFFKVYALDKLLDLPAGTAKGALLKAMEGHILAQAELVGLYKR
ncbi:MAG: YbhB/YbcL family Raf kinase inhibitor-like protein [Elusimicrobiales bacterium]|nr:YbhB/YbcL family Raf kinase inhibitor-like protein [Elusimicrobiales bacterium]